MEKKFSESLPTLKGNFNQLQQVVFNLITNACHAMTGGGILSIKTEPSKTGALMTIHDTGSGIPTSSLKKIFDPFYTTKEKNLGTGLGLYICHEIINNHNGTIKVNSILDKGTAFTIFIPTAAST